MARSCGYDSYGIYRCRQNRWNDWVRWLVLAVIVGGFFFLFILCSCLTARRRRKAGAKPYYGTGWAARPGNYTSQPQYNQPAPPYSAQPGAPQQNSYYGNNTNSGGANQGYYGNSAPYGQQQGVELQSPQPAYTHGGGEVYAPPAGPPPGKMV